jgi:hypothetical protein
VIAAETATALSPDPGEDAHGALDPYEVVVPYSNTHSLTAPAFGFTLAFNVAAVCDTDEAAFVTTVGTFGGVLNV